MHSRMKRFGAAAVATVGVVALASCAGFGGSTSNGGDTGSSGGAEGEGGDRTISFTTWASESEETAFEELVGEFEEQHDATVELNVVPYEQMFTNIDAQLGSGDAPDIFRVDYGNLGVYSSEQQLLDLNEYITEEERGAFTPAMVEAVSYDDVMYGVPHQTDVSALVVNLDMLAEAGVDTSDFPTTQADAWTWEEFGAFAAELRAAMPADRYPFAYNWQLGGTSRWLSWLFQADGQLFAEDGTATIASPEGTRALDFTRSFFEEQWVPPNSSVSSTVYADDLFIEGTTAMVFAGSFLVPRIEEAVDFEWTALPMPVDERGATDLGGNALVATAATEQPELAAEFLEYMASAEAMEAFCAATNELPTRTDIDPTSIDFAVRPDVMPVFVEQATTIEPDDVRQLTSPAMAAIAVTMQDQLEAAFVSGQSTEETLANIAETVEAEAGS